MTKRSDIQLEMLPLTGTLADRLRLPRCNQAGLSLYWLGQAGFVVDTSILRVVIDPYLSNSLAAKYRETPYSHERMVPPPIHPDELGQVDFVFCTHQHTDHMDGETLARLATRLPDLRFIVPYASRDLALERIGCSPDRLVLVDAGQTETLGDSLTLTVTRAAHEELVKTDEGHHRFLGYGLDIGGLRIFHSGDTIPFAGQAAEIASFAPDITLFPVNGRSARMLTAGFAGNMTISEAINLAYEIGCSFMMAHHYGMFSFNTVAPEMIDLAIEKTPLPVQRAVFDMEFCFTLS